MKGERMAKRSSFGIMMKRKLSDITNSQSQSKLPALEEKQHAQVSLCAEDLINQLLMEKTTLVKLVEERNKIIELSGIELRNLRMNYQKLQLQNWHLAQSNSQMLAELNLGRDKVKQLQHELVGKNALLKAKQLELEEGKKAGGSLHETNISTKPSNRSRRRTARSKSMGPSATNLQGEDNEKLENKRRCLRRQSARFKSQEKESSENLLEFEEVNSQMQEEGLCCSSVAKEDNYEQKNGASALHRSSMGRPLRRAVGKVQSYKEVPLNIKMRRKE